MSSLKTQAIQTALQGDWNQAIDLNGQILKENPQDIETLNRLAFAYAILGKTKEARTTYQKVLDLDSVNSIALRGIKKLTKSKNDSLSDGATHAMHYNTAFLEESGKTKVVDLVNLADPKFVSRLRTGEVLTLSVKRLKIFIHDGQKQYVGMLPDDIGKRLIKFLNGGNQYEVYVRGVRNNQVTVFIKETKRATRFKNHPSFIPIGKVNSFSTNSRDYSRTTVSSDDSSEEE